MHESGFIRIFLKCRSNYWLQLATINLRFLISFGFIPSGIKKIMGTPFANLGQKGSFFEYLDALYATGFYYEFIGWAQLIAAILLFTQRFATLGAFMFFPIILNIMVFTLSTIGSLTPLIATLMFLGITYLLIWDYYKWINLFSNRQLMSFDYLSKIPNQTNYWSKVGLVSLLIPFALMVFAEFTNKMGMSDIQHNIPLTAFLSMPLFILMANIWYIFRHKKSIKIS